MSVRTIVVLAVLAVAIPGLTAAVVLADLPEQARVAVTAALSDQLAVLIIGLVVLVAAVVGVGWASLRATSAHDRTMATEIEMITTANPSHRLASVSCTASAVNALADHHQRAEERLVSQVRQAHADLTSERDALLEVLTGLDVPVAVVDAEGRLLLVNPAARSAITSSTPVAAGRSIYSIFDVADFAPVLEAAIVDGRALASIDGRALRLVRIAGHPEDNPDPSAGAVADPIRVLIVGEGSAVEEVVPGSASAAHLRLSSDLARPHRRSLPTDQWWDAPLSDLVCTVVDCETTGLHVEQGDRLVSVAAVRVDGALVRTEDTFEMLANPGMTIPPVAVDIHGITDAMVADAPSPSQVTAAFARYAENSVLVGHHIRFDLGFLTPAARVAGVQLPTATLDTMLLSAVVFDAADARHGLDALCGRLGVTIVGRHTALGDALATSEALVRLLPMLAERGIHTLGQATQAASTTRLARRLAAPG